MALRVFTILITVVMSFAATHLWSAQPKEGFSKATIGNRSFLSVDAVSNPAALIAGLDAEILEVYDDITLVYIRKDHIPILRHRTEAARVELRIFDYYDFIYVNGRLIDARLGTSRSVPLETLDPPYATDESGTWIVQFKGPMRRQWVEDVTAAGMTLVQYLPYNAFIAAARPSVLPTVAAMPCVQYTEQMHIFMKPVEYPGRSGNDLIWTHLAITPDTYRAVARLASLSITPISTAKWSDEELRVEGRFHGNHMKAIISEPLVMFAVLRPTIGPSGGGDPTNIPTLSAMVLFSLVAALAAVALKKLS